MRHLGSSVGLFVSAVTLRDRFKDVLLAFRSHASIAFPALGPNVDDAVAKLQPSNEEGERNVTTPDLTSMSNSLELLAHDLERFLDVRH